MDYTNEIFANIAKEIADRGEHVITERFKIGCFKQWNFSKYKYSIAITG